MVGLEGLHIIAQQRPLFGQCIETPSGEGILNALLPLRNGDYILVIVNFAEKTIERLTVSEWNDYIESTGVFKEIEQGEGVDYHRHS